MLQSKFRHAMKPFREPVRSEQGLKKRCVYNLPIHKDKRRGLLLGNKSPHECIPYRSVFDRCVGSSILASLSEAGGTIQTLRQRAPSLSLPSSLDRHLECTMPSSVQDASQSIENVQHRKCP